MSDSKSEVRNDLKRRWKLVGNMLEKQTQMLGHLQGALDLQLKRFAGGIWMFYSALPGELAVDALVAPNLKRVFPLVNGEELLIVEPGPLGFVKGYAGVNEPVLEGARTWDVSAVEVFLVPGLGFSQTGQRMGRGKGFYDRMLSRSSGLKIGVTLKEMILEELPTEKHDIAMDALVTDQGFRWCQKME